MLRTPLLSAALFLGAAASPATAQFDDPWVHFEPDPALISSAAAVSDANHETDLAWGDLDQDGANDLVVARSRPFMFVGKRRNVLLMNEGGVLVNRTTEFASSSDVPGDLGFLTATQDRDVEVADLTGDGWLDVVTATDLPAVGDSKQVGHPRVYRNLGESGGLWQGLTHEDARIPQLLSLGGAPVNPRFMGVAAADLNNDGALDLYFIDQDYVAAFNSEPAAQDTDDILLLNDGFGFFTDASSTAMTAAMLEADYSNSLALADFNLDGVIDRVKQDSHSSPNAVRLAYNDPGSPGVFGGVQLAYTGSPYFVNTGELNNDGRPDLIVSDNGADKFLLNLGNGGGAIPQVTWSAPQTYDFLSGGDDSFASNNLVADLDQDGWNDVLHTDVDPELSGFNRRLHIYHNRGGPVGGIPTLREERRSNLDTDWVGVVGMETADMNGTHDVAVFDVDLDGHDDLIVSRNTGTVVWRQQDPWTDLDCALAGVSGEPTLTGTGTLLAGGETTLLLENAAPGAPAILFVSLTETPTPFKGGTLKAVPFLVQVSLFTFPDGSVTLPFAWPAGLNPLTLILQYGIQDAAAVQGVSLSNALRADAP